MTIETVATPGDVERDAILAILSDYNAAVAPPIESRNVAFVVRDGDGAITAGLWGRIAYGWLFVQYLAVAPPLRGTGTGSALMTKAEKAARAAGCVGIWLDTFSFQARPFYERLGYGLFATLSDYPPGHARHFLMKRIG